MSRRLKADLLAKTGIFVAALAMVTGCNGHGGETQGTASAASQAPMSDIATIMQWWPGDYSNDRQIERIEAAGQLVWRANNAGKGGHIEVTSHYRKVALPAFGDHVLYVEETKYRDPDDIFRQRIYSLKTDQETGDTHVKLWYFNDKKKYVGAWKDLSIIKDLTPKEMFPLPDHCDLSVKKQGEKYHMKMPDKKCVFGERYFDYQVLLGPDSFWFRDRIVNAADDKVMEAAGDFTYHELDRI